MSGLFGLQKIQDFHIISSVGWPFFKVRTVARSPHSEQMEVRISENIMALVFLDKTSQEEARPFSRRMNHSYS